MKAKTKLTKLWSILLALVMVVGMLPTVALAAEPAPAPATEKADFSTDPTAALALLNAAKTGTTDSTWDSSNNTLTLNGVNFVTTASTAVILPADSTIVLNGENTVNGGNLNSEYCCGIDGLGNLTIKGTGTLNVTGGSAGYDSCGIYAEANVSITGGTVEATGGEADDDSCGIEAEYNVTIIGGTVKATGGATNDNSYGIYGDNVIISGGTVTTTGGAASSYSLGIYAETDVTISGTADVTAEGGSAANYDSNGICAGSNVTITGGTVKATAGTANSLSVGISADSCAVSISGGTVETTGGTAGEDSYGIYADEDIIISDGTVIAKANTSALDYTPQALPSTYWWRTSNSGAYHKYPDSAYIWDAAHTYFEIQKPGYTVTFDANGGSGEMTGADVVSGEYTLPANGFTAPEGKQFKGWSVNGNEKAVGDKITVSADTTVKAVWENITYTVSFDSNGGTGTMTAQTGVLGDYTLPANGFTAPEGKQFKAWSVDGTEKAVGDKITVAADTTVKAVWENIPATPTPTEYEILDGANGSWTQNSDGSLSFRGSGEFSEFVGVKVDGNLVDAKNYTVKEGSTVVTLNADYLNTLTAGNHTLEIVWTDGSASTSFTVSAQKAVENETKSPQTGDNSMMALWIAVLFVSGFGVVATAVYGKKRKSVK